MHQIIAIIFLGIDRVAFAGLTKKNLPRGNWRLLTEQEIINLKNA